MCFPEDSVQKESPAVTQTACRAAAPPHPRMDVKSATPQTLHASCEANRFLLQKDQFSRSGRPASAQSGSAVTALSVQEVCFSSQPCITHTEQTTLRVFTHVRGIMQSLPAAEFCRFLSLRTAPTPQLGLPAALKVSGLAQTPLKNVL